METVWLTAVIMQPSTYLAVTDAQNHTPETISTSTLRVRSRFKVWAPALIHRRNSAAIFQSIIYIQGVE